MVNLAYRQGVSSGANLELGVFQRPIAKCFFGDKGNESDSSADGAVIAHVVNSSSSSDDAHQESVQARQTALSHSPMRELLL